MGNETPLSEMRKRSKRISNELRDRRLCHRCESSWKKVASTTGKCGSGVKAAVVVNHTCVSRKARRDVAAAACRLDVARPFSPLRRRRSWRQWRCWRTRSTQTSIFRHSSATGRVSSAARWPRRSARRRRFGRRVEHRRPAVSLARRRRRLHRFHPRSSRPHPRRLRQPRQ